MGSGRLIFYFLIISFFSIAPKLSFSQQKTPIFYEIIKGDSVALFFNSEGTFTEKECLEFTRYIRVRESGDFNGYFEDYSIDNTLRTKGVYVNGVKHGYFEFYHPSGGTLSRGYYENNKPVGIWEYFYETGIPERTLKITDSEVLLMRFVNSNGIVTIENGNGEFQGFSNRTQEYGAQIKGNVIDGRPDGKWRVLSAMDNSPLYMEKFNHGRMIKTSLVSRKEMTSNTPTLLCNFFVTNYLPNLEGFYFKECNDEYSDNPWRSIQILHEELTRKIDVLIERDIQKRETGRYVFGDNFVTVQFSVNKKGKAEDITLASEWGDHFFETIKSSIKRAKFSTKNETMYFRMRLSYAGGRKYRYTFKFSKHKG
jgi:antitoxin component YwqK of YwqJK toxin-antitoxin module